MFARPTTPLLLSLLASVCAISACTVGPDYAGAPQVAPDAAHASYFVRTPAAGM
ncbi:MAG TPA: TolC family protein, partial [Caballeronia sp.]|nr:TolC family protein [Caballeronia sp.]